MITDEIAFAKPEDVGVSRPRLQALSDALAREIEAGRLPGAVSLIARRGRVVHFKAQGFRDPDSAPGASIERDSLFRIYSMTKPIVSVAIMQLVENGRVRLPDPLSEYLPAFADMRVWPDGEPVRAGAPITIHDLLRHTSGLAYEYLAPDELNDLYLGQTLDDPALDNAEICARLAALPLLAEPGTRWIYGRSTDVLGRVIEVVTGRSLEEALSATLFEPLGMGETGFRVPPEWRDRVAEPFGVDPDDGSPIRLTDPSVEQRLESGGGGLFSTAGDYARFAHMLAAGGSFEGQRLIGPRTLRFMASDHIAGLPADDLLVAGHGFGLGFAVRREDGRAPFPGTDGDFGWEGVAGTMFWVDPAAELYAVLMVQAPGRRRQLRAAFRALVYASLTD